MTSVQVLNVFCNERNQFGNPVGFVSELIEDAHSRQHIATHLGFSETVFVLNHNTREIAIHNPQEEIAFSGHAAVGAAWALELGGGSSGQLIAKERPIDASSEAGLVWVRTRLSMTPPWVLARYPIELLEDFDQSQVGSDEYVLMWDWINQETGSVRARTFAPAWGIPEDEANGSGCMRLAAALGTELTVAHGRGSVVHAKADIAGNAEVGGRVAAVEIIDIE